MPPNDIPMTDATQAARTALVDAAVLFITLPFAGGPARSLAIERMAQILPQLAMLPDGPFYALRIAADRLVTACQRGGDVYAAERGLEAALRGMFAERSDASIARLLGNAPKRY